MLFDRKPCVFHRPLFRRRGFPQRKPAVSEEHVEDLPRHVKGGQKRAEQSQVKRPVRNAPEMRVMEDFVLAPKTGKDQRHAAKGHHANSVSGKSHWHEFAQPAHAANVLFFMAAMNDRTFAAW